MTEFKGDLINLADFAFQRLRGRVAGLGDEEYLWEPVAGCWSVRRGDDGVWRADVAEPAPEPPPFTTVAWRIWHITDTLAADRNATWLGVTPSPGGLPGGAAGTAAEALDRLDDAYERFRGHVGGVDEGTLGHAIGAIGGPYRHSTRAAFILHELDELVHHAAEVALLRDLYRASWSRPSS